MYVCLSVFPFIRRSIHPTVLLSISPYIRPSLENMIGLERETIDENQTWSYIWLVSNSDFSIFNLKESSECSFSDHNRILFNVDLMLNKRGLLEIQEELRLVTFLRNYINLGGIPDLKGFKRNIKNFWTDQKREKILKENAEERQRNHGRPFRNLMRTDVSYNSKKFHQPSSNSRLKGLRNKY